MAFALKGAGSASTDWSITANQSSFVLTTSTTAGAANDLAVLRYAVDNNATADGDEAAVTGVTDSAGNFWQKAVEFTNGQGTAQTGATCGIWYCNLQNALAVGATVTLAFSNNTSRDAAAVGLEYFTKAAGFKATINGTPGTLANDAAAAGSLDVTTDGSSVLRIRATASESSTATAWTKTAAFTAVLTQAISTGGVSATNQGIRGEYLVATAINNASAPTNGAGAVDNASVYVAFKETAFTVGDPPHNSDQVAGAQVAGFARKAVTALLITASTGLFVPFNTPQLSVNFTNFGWSAPLSPAPKVAQPQQGHAFVPFNTPQLSVNFTNLGWHLPTSTAPPVAKAQAGNSFVPFNTAQVVPVAATGIPLNMGDAGPSYRTVYYQSRFETPYVPPAAATTTPYGWQAQLSGAAPSVAQAAHEFGSVPFASFAAPSVQWQQPLSGAPGVAQAQVGHASVPYSTAQLSVNFTNFGWHGPTSTAVPVARAQAGNSFVPFNTAQAAALNYTNFGWYQALSIAAPVAKATQGDAFVPFNTAQIVVGAYTNFYLQPLSVAASVAKATPDFGSVPLSTPATVTVAWQQPLSVAQPVAKAAQGNSFVPFNTAQVIVAAYTNFWLQPLSGAPSVAKAIQGDSFVPFDTAQITAAAGIPLNMGGAAPRLRRTYYQSNFVPPYVVPVVVAAYTNFWLQPLSIAVPVAKAALSDWSLPYTIVAATGVAWQSPLAIAPPVAKAQVGYATVPLSPTQQVVIGWQQPLAAATFATKAQQGFASSVLPYTVPPVAGIAGIAWFSPLGIVPTRLLAAQQGDSFVPFNTAQTVVTATGRRKPLLFISNVGRLMN